MGIAAGLGAKQFLEGADHRTKPNRHLFAFAAGEKAETGAGRKRIAGENDRVDLAFKIKLECCVRADIRLAGARWACCNYERRGSSRVEQKLLSMIAGLEGRHPKVVKRFDFLNFLNHNPLAL